jgi:hypothetical protein
MTKPPRPRDEPIMSSWLMTRYMVTGIYVGFATIGRQFHTPRHVCGAFCKAGVIHINIATGLCLEKVYATPRSRAHTHTHEVNNTCQSQKKYKVIRKEDEDIIDELLADERHLCGLRHHR